MTTRVSFPRPLPPAAPRQARSLQCARIDRPPVERAAGERVDVFPFEHGPNIAGRIHGAPGVR